MWSQKVRNGDDLKGVLNKMETIEREKNSYLRRCCAPKHTRKEKRGCGEVENEYNFFTILNKIKRT